MPLEKVFQRWSCGKSGYNGVIQMREIHPEIAKTRLNIYAIQNFLREYLDSEHLRGVPERMTLLINELGSIAKMWTHDPKNNPEARTLSGSPQDKLIEYGDSIMMLFTVAIEDDVDLVEAVRLALQRLENKEWKTIVHMKHTKARCKKCGSSNTIDTGEKINGVFSKIACGSCGEISNK